MDQVRELHDWEVRILDDLDISLEAKMALKRHWENMPMKKSESVDTKELKKFTISSSLLNPFMIAVFGANLFYGLPFLAKLSNLLVVVAWIMILLVGFAIFVIAAMVMWGPPLNQAVVAMYKNKNTNLLYRYYNLCCNVALVALLALNGYMITSIAMTMLLLVMKLVTLFARVKVQTDLNELVKTAS